MDLARTRPVLLVLGDLHEADAIGLDLIKYLAHLAVGTPLLMVGALRDPDIEADAGFLQMIEAMTRERLWLRIDLHCLSGRPPINWRTPCFPARTSATIPWPRSTHSREAIRYSSGSLSRA